MKLLEAPRAKITLRDDAAYAEAADRLETLKREHDELEPRRQASESRARLAIEDQLADLRARVETQRQVVNHERARASAEICARVRPQYLASVRRLHAALIEVTAAQREHREFLGRLESGDVEFLGEFRPMFFMAAGTDAFGDPENFHSPIRKWLDEAREYGLLTGGGK